MPINCYWCFRHETKIVPKLLSCKQKQCRMDIDIDFLKKVITVDEAWVYGYGIETKAQSSQWKRPEEPRPKKARQARANVKVLLIVFFDSNGMVHHEFLPHGRAVNKEYYLKVMRRLIEAIRRKRTELWWILHHDNATAHTWMLVCEFLDKNKTIIMPQPSYSPDLAPANIIYYFE